MDVAFPPGADHEDCPVMFIALTSATTPAQAIKMAYDFASALRATGWPLQDLDYAREMWIGGEYAGSPLLAYLNAGFGAGYLGEPMPAAQDVTAAELALGQGFAEIQPDDRPAPVRADYFG